MNFKLIPDFKACFYLVTSALKSKNLVLNIPGYFGFFILDFRDI